MARHGQQATTRMKRVALLAQIKSRGLVAVLVWFGCLLGEKSGEQKIQVDRKSTETKIQYKIPCFPYPSLGNALKNTRISI